jgi:hypothetical protein
VAAVVGLASGVGDGSGLGDSDSLGSADSLVAGSDALGDGALATSAVSRKAPIAIEMATPVATAAMPPAATTATVRGRVAVTHDRISSHLLTGHPSSDWSSPTRRERP